MPPTRFRQTDTGARENVISIFTPSLADQANTNAQTLTVKEIVVRLPPDRFRVTMIYDEPPDPRIATRPNTKLLHWRQHGNTLRLLLHCLSSSPDIYFYPRQGPLDSLFLSLRRRLKLRTAVVSHAVSGGLERMDVSSTLAKSFLEADAVFANSTHVARTLEQRLGIKAAVIYNGIDRRFFFPPNVEEERRKRARSGLVVLYAGSFRPYKRVHLVVQQAARWPNVQFRIAGTGEEDAACHALAKQLGCTNLSFLGHLSLADLGEEMRNADIFLFPSALEGHPQVLGQAAACGLPCIAMNLYRPDYVVYATTGFLAESDEELGSSLDVLLKNLTLRQSMSEAAVKHSKQFDWDQSARLWQQAFEEVAARQRRN
jgi:glycosyltransferase involved in cell wall biosynthesis